MNLFELSLTGDDGTEIRTVHAVTYVEFAKTHVVVVDKQDGVRALSKPDMLGRVTAAVLDRFPRPESIWLVRVPDDLWAWQPILMDGEKPRLGPASGPPSWFRSHLPTLD